MGGAELAAKESEGQAQLGYGRNLLPEWQWEQDHCLGHGVVYLSVV